MRKATPVARRVLGECNDVTLKLRCNYANAFYQDPTATLDDLREAVKTLEETEQTVGRVFGIAHPFAAVIGRCLRESRAALCARETPAGPGGS